jgi:hypothetical protein
MTFVDQIDRMIEALDKAEREQYDAAPKCRDCGYPDYVHPIFWHQFNDGWKR